MLHYLTCAAIAFLMAIYLNARRPSAITAAWSWPASAAAGVVVGSAVVLGALGLAGAAPEAGAAMQRIFGAALIWSVAGAAIGVVAGAKNPGVVGGKNTAILFAAVVAFAIAAGALGSEPVAPSTSRSASDEWWKKGATLDSPAAQPLGQIDWEKGVFTPPPTQSR